MDSGTVQAPGTSLVPPEMLLQLRRFRLEYERCWPWLDGAIARFGRTHDREQLWQELSAKRNVFFFSMPHCAAIVRVTLWPTGLKDLHVWLVGGNLREIRDGLYPKMEAWGKQIGCHRIIGYGRRGWLRVLEGWMSHGTTRVKSLMGPQPTEVELKILGYSELAARDGEEG